MRVFVVLSSLALALAAGARATTSRGTLAGVVSRGPVVPVCAAEQPCNEPAANVKLLFVRSGTVVGRATTNLHGRYRLSLPAGWYSVRRAVTAAPVDLKLEPNRARVYPGRVTYLDFAIDTGIR